MNYDLIFIQTSNWLNLNKLSIDSIDQGKDTENTTDSPVCIFVQNSYKLNVFSEMIQRSAPFWITW